MKELNGYPATGIDEIPAYRGPLSVPVEVYAEGWNHSSKKYFITRDDVPDERGFRETQFDVWLNQPLAELEQLAAADADPAQVWPNSAFAQLRKWIDQNRVPHYPDFHAANVRKIIPRSMLHGIIDGVRTRALLFTLDIQAQFPDAGEPNGPTIDTPKVREAVTYNINNHIYGGTNTVANGENIDQTVNIQQGDLAGLMEVLRGLGFGQGERDELEAAIATDDGKPGGAIKSYLARIASGAIKVGGAIATPVTISLAQRAIASFLGVPSL